MELDIFIDHASRFVALQRGMGRTAIIRALAGEDVLHRQDADNLADFLDEVSEDLADERETKRVAEDLRRRVRGG